MMRSLYAGVSGLKTHQTKMDVIGNNIANVNTTAYKTQNVTFSELMYQTTQAASGANPNTGVGGINARQIGLGVKTGAINTDIAGQGASQSTGNPWDIMITGSSFFVVNNGTENMYTRDGSFYLDGAGNLAMTSTGYNVMGWGVDNDGKIKQDSIGPLKIMSNENMNYGAEATSYATVSGVVDKNDSNVNSAGGKIINLEVFGATGYSYTVKMSVHAIDGDQGSYYVKLDGVTDATGKSLTVPANVFGTTQVTDSDGNTVANAANLKFNPANGKFEFVDSGTNKTIKMNLAGVSPMGDLQEITLNFGDTASYNKNKVSSISAVAGDTSEEGKGSGRKAGAMSKITVDNSGIITINYDNGMSITAGQIVVANFANPSGLAKEGDNLYSSTMNSGSTKIEDVKNSGYMTSGVIEMSNVDLSSEFTEMITTQRGFQANSRIITVSDTLLEELTNLKR